MERLRKMSNVVLKNEWMEKDSFKAYKLKFTRFERGYLTEEKLQEPEQKELKIERLHNYNSKHSVPKESVSKLLGHTKMTTTQLYAKIIEKNLSEDCIVIKKSLQLAQQNKNKYSVKPSLLCTGLLKRRDI